MTGTEKLIQSKYDRNQYDHDTINEIFIRLDVVFSLTEIRRTGITVRKLNDVVRIFSRVGVYKARSCLLVKSFVISAPAD